jgi:hypothetical protein
MFGTNAYAQAPFASAGGNAFFVSVSESAVAQDTVAAAANFAVGASISESATGAALDFVAAQTFAVSVSESASGLDALLSRELWEQIDDTQVADWTDILNPTTIEDIAVFGGANFGVVSFAGDLQQRYDPNPVVWNEIDDTQGTTWTDIVAV